MGLPRHQVEESSRKLETVADASSSKAHHETVNDTWGANASVKTADYKSAGTTDLPTLQLVSQDSVEKGISERCNPLTGAFYKGIYHGYQKLQTVEDNANHQVDKVTGRIAESARIVTDPWNRLMAGLTPPKQ